MQHWPEGQPIYVQADRLGAPRRLRWAGALHRVERVLARWRVDEEWWAERVWCEYFELITSSGLLVTLYHSFTDGGWYLEQVYD